jgi:hypothetical protein
MDGGAPSEEALAVLDRLNRLEGATIPAAVPHPERSGRERTPRAPQATRSLGGTVGVAAVVGLTSAVLALLVVAAWKDKIDWRSLVTFARGVVRAEPVSAAASAPLARETSLPLPRRGEIALARARALSAGGHLRDALVVLASVPPTDPQQPDAERMRADLQRQLLALTPVPPGDASDREKGDRRTP